jgi:hypothetical protein
MIESIGAQLGGKLADRLAVALLSPALAFWTLGCAAWIWIRPHSANQAVNRLASLSGLAQGALLIGALMAVAASGVVVQRTEPVVLRLLQGYWPPALRSALASRYRRRLAADDKTWQELYSRWEDGKATETEAIELQAAERRLARLPATPDQVMPTRLGNVLRSAENRPYDWYGLDAVNCWSRLWLVLPDAAKNEVSAARADLDTATTWWTWAALTAVWTVFTPWALLVAVAACLLSYPLVVGSAMRFGDLVNATFDVHRGLLYDALGRPRPSSQDSERATGQALSQALWRGPAPPC